MIPGCGTGLCLTDTACGAIAPGEAVSFAIDTQENSIAVARWAAAGAASISPIIRQEVLFFGSSQPNCEGEPKETIEVAADATSVDWPRLENGTAGTIRFQVRAVPRTGLSATNGCSGAISIYNSHVTISAPIADLALGSGVLLEPHDVTGDGLPDLIYGNSNFDGNRGYIAVVPSGPKIQSSRLRVYRGKWANDVVGSFLSFNDINGDGIDDLISYSASAAPNGIAGAGSVYVILGGELPSSGIIGNEGVGLRYDGESASDGLKADMIADITGDGKKEIIGINYTAAYSGANSGAVFVIPGGAPSGSYLSVGRRYTGSAASDALGNGALLADDVTGDGIKELIIGGVTSNAGGASSGSIYLIQGAATLPASNTIDSAGIRYSGNAGESVGYITWSLGDITGDGIHELVVGGNAGNRITYVVNGGPLAPSGSIGALGVGYTGSAGDSQFPVELNVDLNGDSVHDLIFKGTTSTGFIAGSSSLPISGTLAARAARHYTAIGVAGNSTSIEFPDADGNGTQDLMLCNVNVTVGINTNAGRCYLIFGGASIAASGAIAAIANRQYDGSFTNQRLRLSRGTDSDSNGQPDAGFDFNLDGHKDFYLATSDGPNGAFSGSVSYLLAGSALPASGAISTIGKFFYGDAIGHSIASIFGAFSGSDFLERYGYARDLTGDGVPDIFGYASSFLFYFFPGSATSGALSAVGLRVDDSVTGGVQDLRLADLNGDGLDDVVLMDLLGSLHLLKAPIFSTGAQDVRAIASRTFPSTFGIALPGGISALDANADGYADVVYTTSGEELSIIYGRAEMSEMVSVPVVSSTLDGGCFSGGSVLGARLIDMTGDGKPELITTTSDCSTDGVSSNGAIAIIPNAFLP